MPETSLIPAGKQAIKICGMLNHAAEMEMDLSSAPGASGVLGYNVSD